MSTIGQNLKIQINDVLQTLVSSNALGSIVSADLSKNPIDLDVPDFPVAILAMPQVTSAFEDTANNLRTYRFDILFMLQTDNTVDGTVEGLIDTVLNAFDTNLTLAGVAQGAMLPAEVIPWPVTDGGKTYTAFVVTIKARALYTVGT